MEWLHLYCNLLHPVLLNVYDTQLLYIEMGTPQLSCRSLSSLNVLASAVRHIRHSTRSAVQRCTALQALAAC